MLIPDPVMTAAVEEDQVRQVHVPTRVSMKFTEDTSSRRPRYCGTMNNWLFVTRCRSRRCIYVIQSHGSHFIAFLGHEQQTTRRQTRAWCCTAWNPSSSNNSGCHMYRYTCHSLADTFLPPNWQEMLMGNKMKSKFECFTGANDLLWIFWIDTLCPKASCPLFHSTLSVYWKFWR